MTIAHNEAELAAWLDKLESQLEKLSVEYNQAAFNKYLLQPGNDSAQKKLAHQLNSNLNHYDAAFSALLCDSKNQTVVRQWLPRVTEPYLRRRLECLNQAFLEAEVNRTPAVYELRNLLNDRLLAFQPEIDGQKLKRSDVLEALRVHPDRNYRRRLYENALSPLSLSLARDVRLLMQRRNEAARRLGYSDFATLHLQLIGLDKAEVLAKFDELESLTESAFQAFLLAGREQYGWSQVEAWDVNWLADRQAALPDNVFSRAQIVPTVLRFLHEFFGLDSAKLPVQVVNADIPFAGLCFSIKVPEDIRILCNPKDGYAYYRTMFHEFGHALHAAFNAQTSFILKREPGSFNEGMAETLAWFCQDSAWLAAMTGLSDAEVSSYKRASNLRRIVRFRSLMAQARFEIEAYSNLERDLDRLYAELEARYLCVPLNLTPRWAASAFPITHPVYRQNYIVAEMIAAQTHAALAAKFGALSAADNRTRQAAFAFLVDNYYAPGMRYPWKTKLERATGSSLTSAALANDLNG